jgi:isorenieratene synthase
VGTGGRPPLDNVSVLERYEHEAMTWSRRTGGSVVELHSYAVTAPHNDLRARLLDRLHELYPETTRARVVGEKVLWHNDCPRFAPGDFADRPGVVTPHDGVVLAGDGVRIDLPVALMERAATTGWTAANKLLERFGIRGHALQSVPNQGRSRLLSRVANRGRAHR